MTKHKLPPPAPFPPGIGFNPKPGLHGKGDMSDPKKSGRQHRRNLASPCDRPPAVPQNVRMIFRAVEAKTHLNFKGRITWDDVTTDSSGIPINTVDRWDIEWRAVDADGDPVETEHAALTNATNPAGTTFQYHTARGVDWNVGDRVKIRGCFPQTNYNGTFTITAIGPKGFINGTGGATWFEVDGGHAGETDVNRPGEVYNLSTEQSFRRKLRNPQPRIALRSAHMLVDTSDHSGITAAHNPSGTTYRFDTGPTNDYQVGDYLKVENVSPNAYNGVWKVTNRVDTDTFEVLGDTASVSAGTTGDVYKAATVFEYTTRGTNGFNVGDSVRIVGNRPETAFDGTWDISAVIGDDVFRVRPNRHPDDDLLNAEVVGVVYDNTDALHLVLGHMPRPKTWYWQARVRCRSGEGCWSAFSPWTTTILPWDGADPMPPTPTYGAFPVTFDHKGKGKHRKIRLLFTYDEVKFWDVPGGDREDDVAGYDVQLDSSTDGLNWDTTRDGGQPYRTHHRPANDEDADTTRTAVFGEIHRHYWYRCRVRTRDRFGRKGDWSDWTNPALPFDDTSPPTPLNVEVFPASTDRVVVAWDDPSIAVPTVGTVVGTAGTATLAGTGTHFNRQIEAGTVIKVAPNFASVAAATAYTVKKVTSATALTLTSNLVTSPTGEIVWEIADDPDIAFYGVQLATFANVNLGVAPNEWADVYAHDRTVGTRKAFKIKDSDTDETFFARVRSVDAAGNRSVWVPAWVKAQHADTANSDPDVDGDGVVVIPGSSAITAQWTHDGRLDVDYNADPPDTSHGSLADPYEIPNRFVNQTGIKLWFKNVTLICGDRDAGTGAPTGTGIIVQMRRWNTDGVTADVMFDPSGGDNRPRINTNEYHGEKGVNDFIVTHLDPGEAVSCTLFQYGATFPGRDLQVTLTMSPAAPVSH